MSATDPSAAALAVAAPRREPGLLRRFARRSPVSAFWGVVAGLIVLVAVFAPLIAPSDPLAPNFRMMSKPPNEAAWFGTDQVGRDVLSRVIHGSQTSLMVAVAAVLLGTTVGALWGLACGYFGGKFDLVSQRIIEFMQAFPDLILAKAKHIDHSERTSTLMISIHKTRKHLCGRVII